MSHHVTVHAGNQPVNLRQNDPSLSFGKDDKAGDLILKSLSNQLSVLSRQKVLVDFLQIDFYFVHPAIAPGNPKYTSLEHQHILPFDPDTFIFEHAALILFLETFIKRIKIPLQLLNAPMLVNSYQQTNLHNQVTHSLAEIVNFVNLVVQISMSVQNLLLYVVDKQIRLNALLSNHLPKRTPDSLRIAYFLQIKTDPRFTLRKDDSDGLDLCNQLVATPVTLVIGVVIVDGVRLKSYQFLLPQLVEHVPSYLRRNKGLAVSHGLGEEIGHLGFKKSNYNSSSEPNSNNSPDYTQSLAIGQFMINYDNHIQASFLLNSLSPSLLQFLMANQMSIEPDFLKLKIKSQDGEVVYFQLRKTTPIKKIKNAYANRKELKKKPIYLVYNGERVDEQKTPKDLNMKNDDELDSLSTEWGG